MKQIILIKYKSIEIETRTKVFNIIHRSIENIIKVTMVWTSRPLILTLNPNVTRLNHMERKKLQSMNFKN
jgi:hypothetical protein